MMWVRRCEFIHGVQHFTHKGETTSIVCDPHKTLHRQYGGGRIFMFVMIDKHLGEVGGEDDDDDDGEYEFGNPF